MILGNGWAFFSTPKCATHTMYDVLIKIGGKRFKRGKHPVVTTRVAPLHFTVIRNPYDRAVSIWKFSRPELSFEDFTKTLPRGNKHNPVLGLCQYDWIKQFELDKLVHLENLKEELEAIVGQVPELPVLNKTEHKHYSEYLTETSINYINSWAEKDFEIGGYEKL